MVDTESTRRDVRVPTLRDGAALLARWCGTTRPLPAGAPATGRFRTRHRIVIGRPERRRGAVAPSSRPPGIATARGMAGNASTSSGATNSAGGLLPARHHAAFPASAAPGAEPGRNRGADFGGQRVGRINSSSVPGRCMTSRGRPYSSDSSGAVQTSAGAPQATRRPRAVPRRPRSIAAERRCPSVVALLPVQRRRSCVRNPPAISSRTRCGRAQALPFPLPRPGGTGRIPMLVWVGGCL